MGTKMMLGVGLGFAQTSAPPLTTEIAHPRHRSNVTNMFQAIYYWGAIVSAVATLGTLYLGNSWAWRAPVLLQAFFPLLQILGLLMIPESPRWLVAQGRREEALEMLAKRRKKDTSDDEEVADDGMYHGQKAYQSHIKKSKEIPKSMRVGPQRASGSTIRTVTIVDYQPDVCKDYKGKQFALICQESILI